MTQIADRTVLFADLRGSTSLFETLGNAEATRVVTQCVTALAHPVLAQGGRVVKTLGDGLMALFATPLEAVRAALQMHETLDALASRGREHGSASLGALRLQVGLARGEVVEMSGDVFGDSVNVAARLLDHAGDNETLATDEVVEELPLEERQRYRRLDRLVLRGRAEPVGVNVAGGRRVQDVAATQFGGEVEVPVAEPDGLRLSWAGSDRIFGSDTMPVVLGRSPQAAFSIDDSRVSRLHARVDWHGGSFQLTDLSYNGTYVRFADGEVVSLRRGSCALHGQGTIGLGSPPGEGQSAQVRFAVLRMAQGGGDRSPWVDARP